jgi:hypothetical protein
MIGRFPLQMHETWPFAAERNTTREAGEKMSQKLSFKDANGRTISGHFVVSKGIMTVIARDGSTATADLTESMLSPETLARAILFQLHARNTGEEPEGEECRPK